MILAKSGLTFKLLLSIDAFRNVLECFASWCVDFSGTFGGHPGQELGTRGHFAEDPDGSTGLKVMKVGWPCEFSGMLLLGLLTHDDSDRIMAPRLHALR